MEATERISLSYASTNRLVKALRNVINEDAIERPFGAIEHKIYEGIINEVLNNKSIYPYSLFNNYKPENELLKGDSIPRKPTTIIHLRTDYNAMHHWLFRNKLDFTESDKYRSLNITLNNSEVIYKIFVYFIDTGKVKDIVKDINKEMDLSGFFYSTKRIYNIYKNNKDDEEFLDQIKEVYGEDIITLLERLNTEGLPNQ